MRWEWLSLVVGFVLLGVGLSFAAFGTGEEQAPVPAESTPEVDIPIPNFVPEPIVVAPERGMFDPNLEPSEMPSETLLGAASPLDDSAVRSVVSASEHRRMLQRCYNIAIRGVSDPPDRRLDVSIRVAASGRVTSATVTGDELGPLNRCVEDGVRRWDFPESSAGGEAIFPIVFSSPSSAPSDEHEATEPDPSAGGPLDDAAVLGVVRDPENRQMLQRCYNTALQDEDPLSPRVDVRIQVAPSGRVTSVVVTGQSLGQLHACLETSIQRWVFPESAGGVVAFPVVFSAR